MEDTFLTIKGTLSLHKTPKIDETAKKLLEENVRESQAATVSDRRCFLEHLMGDPLSDSTVRRLLKRLGFSRKKKREVLERDEWLIRNPGERFDTATFRE